MRTFLRRIAANAGSSLTAGGTVLAIGVALGAIGLAEVTTAKKPPSPFENGWVLVGLVLGVVGAIWTIGTFILTMVTTSKHDRFQELLGHALNDGEQLEDDLSGVPEIKAWAQQTHDLIEAGLAPSEPPRR